MLASDRLVPPPRWRRATQGAAYGLAAGLVTRDLGLSSTMSYQGSRVVLVLFIAFTGALVGLTPWRRLLVVALAALTALWLIVAFTPVTRLLARGLVDRDAPASADAIFVLASDVQDDGELNGTALSRLHHALALLRAGHATRLVVSDIVGRPSHSAAVARILNDLAVSAELIAVGPVNNTHDEATAVAALFRQHGWRRVLLVTSPLHSRRGAATLRRQGLEVLSSPAHETEFDVDNLDELDERLRSLGPILHERVGLVVYGWRGWL